MAGKPIALIDGRQISSRSIFLWRMVQAVVWMVGASILICLLFFPATGILLFWNVLIPVAPALFVAGIGIWRNVCPLGTTNLLPRHLGLSKKKKLSALQMGVFSLIAVVALFIIVPLRHALFNSSGMATALLIISTAAVSVAVGLVYEWKSAWCSGLCPIHPVEKLYGGNVLVSVPNAHCDQCMNCVVPCPDSTPNISPKSSTKTIYHKLSGLLICGGLPGFIWGWFHVPDETKLTTVNAFLSVYRMPFTGLAITLSIYAMLLQVVKPKSERILTAIFAASGVACYYWYRIPSLFGFGLFNKDGQLINLTGILPQWGVLIITVTVGMLLFYVLVVRERNKKSWLIRPQFAAKQRAMPGKSSV